MKISLEKFLSFPKSIYVNLRLFPIKDALKLPILCRYNVKCLSLKGKIIVEGGVKPCMLHVGFGRVGIFDKDYSRSILQIDGTIHLEGLGRYYMGHGCRICVMKNAHLYIKKEFVNSAEMSIVCSKEIHIGHHVTTSWNTLVMDTDFHITKNTITNECYPAQSPIFIGNNVWICTRAVVLKGTEIPNGCIVGANTVVSKKFQKGNTLIAGNPAMVKKERITMRRERIKQ